MKTYMHTHTHTCIHTHINIITTYHKNTHSNKHTSKHACTHVSIYLGKRPASFEHPLVSIDYIVMVTVSGSFCTCYLMHRQPRTSTRNWSKPSMNLMRFWRLTRMGKSGGVSLLKALIRRWK